jgi:putative hydrolase
VRPVRSWGAPRYDFHAHSFLSDGGDSPTGMWTEGRRIGHRVLALTDHLSLDDPAPLLRRLHREARAWEGDPFVPLVGVELTLLPPRKIAGIARAARRAGAEIVIVHGETLAEHVPEGTNRAAIESGLVDVLAHPGLLTPEEAQLAKDHSVALEISARKGHSLGNGLVAQVARAVGAELVVDSDAHAPEQLVPAVDARRIALGAGIPEKELDRVLEGNPKSILRRCQRG